MRFHEFHSEHCRVAFTFQDMEIMGKKTTLSGNSKALGLVNPRLALPDSVLCRRFSLVSLVHVGRLQ
jgi:hypothetical protein